MAGVKVRCSTWPDEQSYIEIIFVAERKFLARFSNGNLVKAVNETSYPIRWDDHDVDWLLYEEPKPEVNKINIYEEALWSIKDLKPSDSVREAFAIAGAALKRGNEV